MSQHGVELLILLIVIIVAVASCIAVRTRIKRACHGRLLNVRGTACPTLVIILVAEGAEDLWVVFEGAKSRHPIVLVKKHL